MQRRIRFLAAALVMSCALAGCDESDAVAIRIDLKGDLSGRVTTRSLVRPEAGGAVEQASSGVVWADRVTLVASQGSFGDLSALGIEDIAFAGGQAEGLNFLKVTVPLGEAIKWPDSFTIADIEARKRAAATFDPEGNAKKVGATLKIEIELPSTAVGHGATPAMAGLKEEVDKRIATLVVPVDKARAEQGEIVWHLTW